MTADLPRRDHRALLAKQRGLPNLSSPLCIPICAMERPEVGWFQIAKFLERRFEKLKGARSDAYSIRINDQWRVCFKWPAGSSGPEDVTIED